MIIYDHNICGSDLRWPDVNLCGRKGWSGRIRWNVSLFPLFKLSNAFAALMSCDWQSLHSSVFLLHPECINHLLFGDCLSSHQPMLTKHLPPSCSLHIPGTKSTQLYMPRGLPRGWPRVLTSRPLPNWLWKLPYEVYSVHIWWAWTGELMVHGTDENRSGTTHWRPNMPQV